MYINKLLTKIIEGVKGIWCEKGEERKVFWGLSFFYHFKIYYYNLLNVKYIHMYFKKHLYVCILFGFYIIITNLFNLKGFFLYVDFCIFYNYN